MSRCCTHPVLFLHFSSLLSQLCRKSRPPWRSLSISTGQGKEAPSLHFLVQSTWTPSCRWPSGTSQPPPTRASLVRGQLLGARFRVVFLQVSGVFSWLQHQREYLLRMLRAGVCSRAWGIRGGLTAVSEAQLCVEQCRVVPSVCPAGLILPRVNPACSWCCHVTKFWLNWHEQSVQFDLSPPSASASC